MCALPIFRLVKHGQIKLLGKEINKIIDTNIDFGVMVLIGINKTTDKEIEELNIGHSIICRSVFVGIIAAVEEMLSLAKG